MQKILKIFSIIVIFMFILSLFGWTVYQISVENKRFGFLTEPIKFMYTFPDLFTQSVEEVKEGLPETFIPTDKEFIPINKLEEDVYALTSYSDTGSSRSVIVRNLKNDSVLHKWTVNNPHDEATRIFHPVYLHDGSLVYYFGYRWSPMRRIDSTGNLIWEQDQFIFHHGMELNKDGDIWVCAREGDSNSAMCKIEDRIVFYVDYVIAKLDIETGEVIFHKSVSELLKENNLTNYILKAPAVVDPLHLNDIQPAFKSTKYYEEDDVFLSLRSISCVIHYRPATNKVVNIIEGPFVNQHDVDFLNDHTLAFFNNNLYVGGFYGSDVAPADSSKLVDMGDFYSSIVTYDLSNGEFSSIGDSVFRANKIYTRSEGLQVFINPDTYFVEEQNSGLLWIIRDDEVIYKDVFKSQHKGYHHLPNWTRIIKYD